VFLGTIIDTINEGWSVVESFDSCVMTLTTIGDGDFGPTGPAMQLDTVEYAVLGNGCFVSFNARLVQVAIESRRQDVAATGPQEARSS